MKIWVARTKVHSPKNTIHGILASTYSFKICPGVTAQDSISERKVLICLRCSLYSPLPRGEKGFQLMMLWDYKECWEVATKEIQDYYQSKEKEIVKK